MATACAALGCGAGDAGPPGPKAPNASGRGPLAAYAGRSTELFDDAVEPSAVGLELSPGPPPAGDPLLRERAQRADAVVRARVTTITSKVDAPDAAYVIGFRPLETLAGAAPLSPDSSGELMVRFGKNSPSLAVLRSFEGRLVGSSMVLFLRAFARPAMNEANGRKGDDFDLHTHVSPDRADVANAVRAAVVLDEVAHGRRYP